MTDIVEVTKFRVSSRQRFSPLRYLFIHLQDNYFSVITRGGRGAAVLPRKKSLLDLETRTPSTRKVGWSSLK